MPQCQRTLSTNQPAFISATAATDFVPLLFMLVIDQPAWPGGKADKWKDAGLTPRFGSPPSSKIVIYGLCLMTLPCTINERLKWLTLVPAFLMRKSFWW